MSVFGSGDPSYRQQRPLSAYQSWYRPLITLSSGQEWWAELGGPLYTVLALQLIAFLLSSCFYLVCFAQRRGLVGRKRGDKLEGVRRRRACDACVAFACTRRKHEDLQIDHVQIDPDPPFMIRCAGSLYTDIDPTQEACLRSCRLHGSHPVARSLDQYDVDHTDHTY